MGVRVWGFGFWAGLGLSPLPGLGGLGFRVLGFGVWVLGV